ncbi:MAG: hypothetical protein ACI4DO_02205 [Roseburia sp.]
MIAENKFSRTRLGNILRLLVLLLLDVMVLTLFHRLSVTRGILMAALVILFSPVFFASVSLQRIRGELNGDTRSNLDRFTLHFSGCILLCLIFSFLPAYSAPAMIPAVWLICISGVFPGMCGSIFLLVLSWVGSGTSGNYLLAQILLVLYGCLGVCMLKKKCNQIHVLISLFIAGILIPAVCSCLDTGELNYPLFFMQVGSGMITILFLIVAYEPLTRQRQETLVRNLNEIIQPDYPLVRDMKSYSEVDYVHAVKVSRIACACAEYIHADSAVAAAAGFYYRLGKLAGAPFVENGVTLAKEHCFPESVVTILSEYNGDENAISSLESAIVHMADCLVTKFELLDRDTFRNNWNHDMVIYQTMNEKSSSGLYDQSGMSMNQFLKIRDFLSKGVDLF